MSERQPMPTPNNNPAIVDLVLADLRQRDALGVKTYGTRLQAHNGRDALRDAYEEALDMALYLRQCIEERRAPPTTLSRLAAIVAAPLAPDVGGPAHVVARRVDELAAVLLEVLRDGGGR